MAKRSKSKMPESGRPPDKAKTPKPPKRRKSRTTPKPSIASSTTQVQPEVAFRIFDLPPELRLDIHNFALQTDEVNSIILDRRQPAFLRACKLMRKEALPLYRKGLNVLDQEANSKVALAEEERKRFYHVARQTLTVEGAHKFEHLMSAEKKQRNQTLLFGAERERVRREMEWSGEKLCTRMGKGG